MEDAIQSINELLGPTLVHALTGLFVLLVGLFLVKMFCGISNKLLGKVPFLEKHELIKPIASFVKAILTIFVLMAVLQHFGLTDVLMPLQNMVDQFLSAVPRIIGAGVVAYAGWVIAKIVSELAGVGLKKVDEKLAEKTDNQSIELAKFGSAFIFGGILLPIIVAALGVLDIPAISNPASDMLNELMAAVPNIVGAAIILLVTYFVTKFVIYMLSGLLNGMHINTLPEKLGIAGLFGEKFTPLCLIGGSIMCFSMLAATTAALNTLGIEILSNIFAKVLEFGGGILVGALILIIGNFLSKLAYNSIIKSSNALLARVAQFAILGLVLGMGLKAMGLADSIVTMAFGFTIGAVAVALALAFGLGGRDAAKELSDHWVSKVTKK